MNGDMARELDRSNGEWGIPSGCAGLPGRLAGWEPAAGHGPAPLAGCVFRGAVLSSGGASEGQVGK